MENQEISNLIKIMGLRYKEKYDTPESMKTLRYGKIMIMTDQDQDGSHIKGLLVNFIHHNWPGLLKQQTFLEEFITPIVKVDVHSIKFAAKAGKLWYFVKIVLVVTGNLNEMWLCLMHPTGLQKQAREGLLQFA